MGGNKYKIVKPLWHKRYKPTAKNVERMSVELAKMGFGTGRVYPRAEKVAWATQWKNKETAFYAPVTAEGNTQGVIYMKAEKYVEVATFWLTDTGVEISSTDPVLPDIIARWR